MVDTILAAHDYPPAIAHLLTEALVVTALVGGLLKDDGAQLTMQAQTEGGVVSLMVCDYRDGALRGYVDFDRERLATLGANPTLAALFGGGYLALTFDLPRPEGRYQGIVPLEGDSIAAACQAYFFQSEQVPTLIRVGVTRGADGVRGGGLLIQHLAEGEGGARAFAYQARPSRMGTCRDAGRLHSARGVDRSRPVDGGAGLATVSRRDGSPHQPRGATGTGLPLHGRALSRRPRPLSRGRTQRNAR